MRDIIAEISIYNPDTEVEFRQLNDISNQICQINNNSNQTKEIVDPEIQQETKRLLTDRQTALFGELTTRAFVAPYDILHQETEDLEAALDRQAIQDKEEKRRHVELINHDIKVAKQLAPWGEEQLELIGETKKTQFRLSSDLVDKTIIEQKQAHIQRLWELAGTAWAIPQLIESRGVQQETDDQIVALDEFPVEKETNERSVIAEKVRRKNPEERLKDASIYLGLVLGEEPQTVFTYEQLGDSMYPDEVRETGTHRVSALISNFELSKSEALGACLDDQGLVLQRGRRTYHKLKTHEKIGGYRAIFRTVPLEQAERHDTDSTIVNGLTRVDSGWKTVKPELVESSDQALGIKSTAETAEQKKLHVSFHPTKNHSVEIGKSNPTGITDISGRGIPKEPGLELIDIPYKKLVTKKLSKPERSRGLGWQEKLNRDIGSAMERLALDGLMIDEDISAGVASQKCSSYIFGTRTALERLDSAKIISLRGHSGDIHHFPLTPETRVVMAVFNPNQQLLSGGNGIRRQKQALKIIKQAVESYFKHNS